MAIPTMDTVVMEVMEALEVTVALEGMDIILGKDLLIQLLHLSQMLKPMLKQRLMPGLEDLDMAIPTMDMVVMAALEGMVVLVDMDITLEKDLLSQFLHLNQRPKLLLRLILMQGQRHG